MAGARGQHYDVPGLQSDGLSLIAAEADARVAAGGTEYFVRAGMIMHVIIDPVAPAAAPPVVFEQPFEDGGRIGVAFHVNGGAIVDERQLRIVRDEPVVVE